MKIFGDPNGQIELRAKQKYKVLSATWVTQFWWVQHVLKAWVCWNTSGRPSFGVNCDLLWFIWHPIAALSIIRPCAVLWWGSSTNWDSGVKWINFMSWGVFFYSSAGKRIGFRKFWKKGLWLVEEKFYFIFEFYLYISTGCVRRTYLRSNVFYSFCNKPPFRQHPVNVLFSTEIFACRIFFPGVFSCLFTYLFICLNTYLFICLFILLMSGYIHLG